MKKIVFITNRLPFPNNDGRKNILSQYINHIKKIFPNAKIFNFSFIDEMKYLESVPVNIEKVYLLDKPGFLEKIFNIIFYSLLLKKWPLQVSLFFSRKTKKKIDRLVNQINPDVIIFDMIRVSEYLSKYYQGKTILNYDDILSLRYLRQINHIEYIPSIFGGMKFKLPYFAKEVFQLNKIKELVLRFESNLLSKYEKNVSYRFDHLIFTSPKEAKSFKNTTNHVSSIGIPMVFDVEKQKISRSYNKNKIVFLGRMDIPHNVSAVLYFVNNIWNRIKKTNPEAQFHIVGMNPVKEISCLNDDKNGIVVTGEVSNVKDYIYDAAVFVAPLLYGTGIKTKIIESLALGIPVVSTTIGAEGIPYKNKVDMYISDDSLEFTQYTLDLMNNKDLNFQSSYNGQLIIKKHFSQEAVKELWCSILEKKVL
jgi:glycosyltransferase involved in cell wall biosynthesis